MEPFVVIHIKNIFHINFIIYFSCSISRNVEIIAMTSDCEDKWLIKN